VTDEQMRHGGSVTPRRASSAKVRLLGAAYAVVVNGPDREISDRLPGQLWIALPDTAEVDVVLHTGTAHIEVVFRCEQGGRHTDIPITGGGVADRLRVLIRMADDDGVVITYPVSATYVSRGEELRMDWGPMWEATA
jgi:hypothetical protein